MDITEIRTYTVPPSLHLTHYTTLYQHNLLWNRSTAFPLPSLMALITLTNDIHSPQRHQLPDIQREIVNERLLNFEQLWLQWDP